MSVHVVATLLAIFTAAFAWASRFGRVRVHPASTVAAVLGAALVALVSLRAPLAGYRIPSVSEILAGVYGAWMLVGAIGVAASGRRRPAEPGTRAVALVVAVLAISAFAFGVVRSRGRPDASSCVSTLFADEKPATVTSGRFRATAPVEAGTRPGGTKICTLAIEADGAPLPPLPVFDGRTYGGTPICATGKLALCGDVAVVADGEPAMYALDYERFRAFRLPSLDAVPWSVGGGAVGPPRELLVLAAVGAIVAAAGAVARRRTNAGACATLGAALATPLVTFMLPLVT